MQQYFMKENLQLQQRYQMDKEQSHHIEHVVRLKQGERIRIVDEWEHVFLAHVEFQGSCVYAYLDEVIPWVKDKVEITLAQGVIKGDKWDFLLQKVCEVGVKEVLPFLSSRCVVKQKDEKKERKLERWNKIAREACEQCKRADIVKVQEVVDISEISSHKRELNLLAYENADRSSDHLYPILQQHPDCTSILCVIGPEGGFSEAEVEALEAQGFLRVSLGKRILRAETAAISIINSIQFYYER